MRQDHRRRRPWTFALLLALGACGGGGEDPGNAPAPPPAAGPPLVIASGPSPVAAACTGGSASGTYYADAEVEPWVAVDPTDSRRLLAAWQQDRWSNGAARALVSAVSSDGGATWQRTLQPFSRCGGAAPGSAGDLERSTDPWVDVAPDGTMHLMGLALSGTALVDGSVSAMLASRSSDGGRSWSAPVDLVRDGGTFFHDKNTLTADPLDARFVYAVWDRLDRAGRGPTLLARSIDGGQTWEPARVAYAPVTADGTGVSQTIGNRIVVLTGGPERGLLVNAFTQIDTSGNGQTRSRLGVLRSADRGVTWSPPVFVAEMLTVGTRDAATGTAVRDGGIIPSIAAGPDGTLWIAWQDARFNAGTHDAIAVSRSGDGGRRWSAPVSVNRVAAAPAFTPVLHVRADGLVGLLHYDLRDNTADRATLPASAWLLTTRDGSHWVESPVAGPFDLMLAPDAGGRFLGDYHGLAASSDGFIAVLGVAGTSPTNRSDIAAQRVVVAPGAMGAAGTNAYPARPASADRLATGQERRLQAAHHAAVVAAMERRLSGWQSRVGARPPGDGLR